MTLNTTEEWRDISIFHNLGVDQLKLYQCSNLGNFRRWDEKLRDYVKVEGNTSRGYSIFAKMINRRVYRYFMHRLVAIAFIPVPEGLEKTECITLRDGIPYIVNHKNGNKADNRVENLEWTNMANNNQHAWDTGLVMRHRNVMFIVTDILYDKTYHFKTQPELASFLGIPVKNIFHITSKDNEFKFKGKFIINKTKAHYERNLKIASTDIVVKDFSTNTIFIYESIAKASFTINVVCSSISKRAHSHKKGGRITETIAGYDFKYLSDFKNSKDTKWIFNITPEEAIKQREIYFRRAAMGIYQQSNTYKVKNYETGEILYFEGRKDVQVYLNKEIYNVFQWQSSRFCTIKKPRPYKGHYCMYEYKATPWPEFTEDEIRESYKAP